MGEKSKCQKCGAKFRWWLRHRHYCDRCKLVICDNCSEKYDYTPDRVKQWNFEQVELCKDCYPLNTRDLATERLDKVIEIYFQSNRIACSIITDYRGFTDEEESFFLNIKDMPYKIFHEASFKGYLSGVSDGRKENERHERLMSIRLANRKLGSIFVDKDDGRGFDRWLDEQCYKEEMRSLKGRTDETHYQTAERIFGKNMLSALNDK